MGYSAAAKLGEVANGSFSRSLGDASYMEAYPGYFHTPWYFGNQGTTLTLNVFALGNIPSSNLTIDLNRSMATLNAANSTYRTLPLQRTYLMQALR